MKIRTLFSVALSLLLVGTFPCFAAEEFNRLKTIPTEHCDLSLCNYPTVSPLRRKSVVFFGDSLCNASGESNSSDATVKKKAGYAGRIGNKFEMTYYKEGVSGSAFMKSSTRGSTIGAKINAFAAEHSHETFDYVILEGGVNDAWDGAPLGNISESFQKTDFNTATFAGAVEAAVYDAKQAFPNATIGFLIVYKMPIATYGGTAISGLRDNVKMEPYMNMLIEICEKWELPYLDFYHDDAFNRTVFKTDTNTYLSDGIHMNSAGYDLIADYIAAWMSEPYRTAPKQDTTSNTETDITENPPADPPTNSTGETSTTDEHPKQKKTGTARILAGFAGAAIVAAAAVTGVSVYKKNRKKKK